MMFGEHRRVKVVEGRYSVGDDGVVFSDGMPLKAVGGTWVSIYGQRRSVAYLVARAFVPNAEGRPWVRHKNGDPADNRAENLEWCDEKETGRKRGRKASARRFGQYRWDGELVNVWYSVREASDATGVSVEKIWAALRRRGRSGGWRWMWF